MKRCGRTVIIVLVLCAFATSLGGCVYFNTFSNAKKLYKEGEETQLDPQGNVTSSARKKYNEAIARCQKLMELYPDSKWVDDALFLMSKAYFQKREYSRCIRRIDELEERFPENEFREETLYMRGVCYLEIDEESRAIATLERLEEEFPKSKHLAEGMYRSGEADYRLGNWRSAIGAYGRLLDRFENSDWNDEARLRISKSHHELHEDTLAVTALVTLAEVGKDRGIVFDGELLKAEILIDLNRIEESRELLERLEETAVNFQKRPETLLLLARVFEEQEDLETTITTLENISTEFPRSVHSAEAWYRIGLIRQVKQSDLEGAVEAYDQVTKEIGRSLFTDLARRKKTAIQELLDVRAAIGDAPPDSSAANIQFRMAENQFLNLEDPTAALIDYQSILDLYPDNPVASSAAYAIAYIHRYSFADTTGALEAISIVLTRYPDSEAARFVAGWTEELTPSGVEGR
ncbi:MAG: tetratricopeptide repeat protein [bacterium]|nr:tetratricopeptide repeat protein [bacterium]